MQAEISAFLFIFFTGILFFVPGFVLIRIFFQNRKLLSEFETFLFSFCLSVGLMDFIMLALGKLNIPFTKTSISLGILFSFAIAFLISFLFKRFRKNSHPKEEETAPFSFSKYQSWLFILLIVLTFLIKTAYLSHAVLPTATDLGHHMYWSKVISETGALPFYGKQEIETMENGDYVLSDEPKAIADFIIGEHLPFSALNIFSKVDYFTAFPVTFLFLINILSVLALVSLSFRLAMGVKDVFPKSALFTGENIALATLLFFGPLYTLASPQAKFVSGGVVGNTFGNLFIPLIILAYYRAFKEKSGGFLALGFFLTFTLAYTHHLSTFILLFALVFSAILYLVFHWNSIGEVFHSWVKIIIHPASLVTLFFIFAFFFLVAMPTYIETNAVGTAVGTPTKSTRTGLSFLQVTFSSGEARVALGLVGTFLLLLLRSRATYAGAFLLGWSIILLMMTLNPDALFIDIPSNRIGAYLSFPLGVLASFSLIAFFALLKDDKKSFVLPGLFVLIASISLFTFSFGSGSYDNSQTFLPESKSFLALETFHASTYLSGHITEDDIVLKDHNYITADSWMKLFFLRDYSYPLSRGFFKRYEDNPNREQCTLLMISVPNTPKGEKCYAETGTNLVVINPHFDATQFEKSEKFSRIYASDSIHIYRKQ